MQTYFTTAAEFGYHALDSCTVYKLSGDIINGSRVIKEVLFTDSKIRVKIGGKPVANSDIAITDECHTLDSLHHTLKHVDNMQVCHGFEWVKKGFARWENAGVCRKVCISKSCIGYLKDKQRNHCCSFCTKLEKDIKYPKLKSPNVTHQIQNDLPVYDHSYALEQIIPKKAASEEVDVQQEEPDLNTSQISTSSSDCHPESDSENIDPDYNPHEEKPKQQKPKSTCAYSDEYIDQACDTLLKMCPSLHNVENFKLLLKCQIANSAKSDKHLRRWEPRLNTILKLNFHLISIFHLLHGIIYLQFMLTNKAFSLKFLFCCFVYTLETKCSQ